MYRLIRFEIKKSTTTAKGKTISLLDFTVIITKEGIPELEFYRKKAKKPMFIHYKSAIPKQAKYNVIRKERNLIDQRCCAQSAKHKHQLDFTHTRLLNEYPVRWIQDTQLQPRMRTTRSRQPDDNIDWLYLSTPYVSDDHKIRNIFKHEGLRVRIAHKSTALRKTNHRSVIDKTVSSLRAAYALIRMWHIRSPATNATSST